LNTVGEVEVIKDHDALSTFLVCVGPDTPMRPATSLSQSRNCRQVVEWKTFQDRSENEYAVKAGDLQRVRIPPGQSVARPEATRAMEEVTNLLKYSGVTGHLG
jgi:NAD/NADP transhydrogenase beta subunit